MSEKEEYLKHLNGHILDAVKKRGCYCNSNE